MTIENTSAATPQPLNVEQAAKKWTWKDVAVQICKVGVVVAASAAGTMIGMKLAAPETTESHTQQLTM